MSLSHVYTVHLIYSNKIALTWTFICVFIYFFHFLPFYFLPFLFERSWTKQIHHQYIQAINCNCILPTVHSKSCYDCFNSSFKFRFFVILCVFLLKLFFKTLCCKYNTFPDSNLLFPIPDLFEYHAFTRIHQYFHRMCSNDRYNLTYEFSKRITNIHMYL